MLGCSEKPGVIGKKSSRPPRSRCSKLHDNWLNAMAWWPPIDLRASTGFGRKVVPDFASWTPAQPPRAQVSAGARHTALLRSDGRVVTCGDNGQGQRHVPPGSYIQVGCVRDEVGEGLQCAEPPLGYRGVGESGRALNFRWMMLRGPNSIVHWPGAILSNSNSCTPESRSRYKKQQGAEQCSGGGTCLEHCSASV